MDTRTGEIGDMEELLRKAISPTDIVPLGNLPDKNCPKCRGTGRLPLAGADPTTFRWVPCDCTNPPKHSATFERLRKP